MANRAIHCRTFRVPLESSAFLKFSRQEVRQCFDIHVNKSLHFKVNCLYSILGWCFCAFFGKYHVLRNVLWAVETWNILFHTNVETYPCILVSFENESYNSVWSSSMPLIKIKVSYAVKLRRKHSDWVEVPQQYSGLLLLKLSSFLQEFAERAAAFSSALEQASLVDENDPFEDQFTRARYLPIRTQWDRCVQRLASNSYHSIADISLTQTRGTLAKLPFINSTLFTHLPAYALFINVLLNGC